MSKAKTVTDLSESSMGANTVLLVLSCLSLFPLGLTLSNISVLAPFSNSSDNEERSADLAQR